MQHNQGINQMQEATGALFELFKPPHQRRLDSSQLKGVDVLDITGPPPSGNILPTPQLAWNRGPSWQVTPQLQQDVFALDRDLT